MLYICDTRYQEEQVQLRPTNTASYFKVPKMPFPGNK